MSKLIIIAWTALCIWVTYQQLMEHHLPGQPVQDLDGYTLFAGFLWWSFVAVPVALVGLLFKRRS